MPTTSNQDPLAQAKKRGVFRADLNLRPFPTIEEVTSVGRVGYVPHGEEEGTPYLSFGLKDGKVTSLYGHFSEELRRVEEEVERALRARK